ncbi:hypothetical protein K0M31_008750 [Melipona bicolor]|uniref:Uncharacterized protein n=1 Tax=Melipona bicolor TaxID=60889 RepID=A0AA40FPR7_9HYME|nr:hypothetical protein K0M31_008750 [Melipona bicolor]
MRAVARGKPAKVGLTRVIVTDEVARQSASLADQRNKVARGNRPAYSSYRENRVEDEGERRSRLERPGEGEKTKRADREGMRGRQRFIVSARWSGTC